MQIWKGRLREGPPRTVFPKDFTSSNASDPKGGPRMGTILHYVLSLVKTVVVVAAIRGTR